MRSFLLIICTPRFVTAACAASSRRYSDVPAFGQILLRQRGATLGPFFLLLPLARGPDRFRLALHVAMQIGLSHPIDRSTGLAYSL
jgi:hypothetical protein